MKISYRNNPFFRIFENGDLSKVKFDTSEKSSVHNLFQSLQDDYFPSFCKACRSNTFYLSQNYLRAFDLAADRLFEYHSFEKLKAGSFLFMQDSKGHPGCKEVIMIDILELNPALMDGICIFKFAHFIDDSPTAIGNVCVDIQRSGYVVDKSNASFYFQSENLKNFDALVINTILLVMFYQFAEVETKILPPRSRVKNVLCKYVNETQSTVKILDIRHFTTLYQQNGFPVRGHFRWQPCGEGLKDRKLIWINEFQKEGYTAPARKLSQSTN